MSNNLIEEENQKEKAQLIKKTFNIMHKPEGVYSIFSKSLYIEASLLENKILTKITLSFPEGQKDQIQSTIENASLASVDHENQRIIIQSKDLTINQKSIKFIIFNKTTKTFKFFKIDLPNQESPLICELIDCKNFTNKIHYALQKPHERSFIICEFDFERLKQKKPIAAFNLYFYKSASTVINYQKNFLYIMKPPLPSPNFTAETFVFSLEIFQILTGKNISKIRKLFVVKMSNFGPLDLQKGMDYGLGVVIPSQRASGLMLVDLLKRRNGVVDADHIMASLDDKEGNFENLKDRFFSFKGEESSILWVDQSGCYFVVQQSLDQEEEKLVIVNGNRMLVLRLPEVWKD